MRFKTRATIFTALLITILSLSTSSQVAPPQTALNRDTFVSKLSIHGPEFPPSFNTNDLSMFYIVRGNWPVVVRYELPRGSAKLQVKGLERGFVTADLPATARGKIGKFSLMTSAEFGDGPQPGEIRITAYGPANFVLHSLACGNGALLKSAAVPRRAETVMASRNHFLQVGNDEVAITGIMLSPRDLLNASGGSQLNFSFKSANDFPMWSAILQRQVQGSGSRWLIERTLQFANDPIFQGQTKGNSWDGKNEKGKVIGGRYKIMISAWTSAGQDGSALTSFSSPAITVK